MPRTTYQARVERIEVLSYNVRSFTLKLEEPNSLAFQAGQFVIVDVPKDDKTVKRAYSVASAPHEPTHIELCIQHVEGGAASTYFWNIQEKDPVTLSGPFGNFLLKEPLDYEPVFMATGTGVAPLRSMIKHLVHVNCQKNIWLVFGTRYEHALLYESEFRALASARRNFHFFPTVSRPKEWRGETGHIQDTFKNRFKKLKNLEIYLCGWDTVIRSVCSDLQEYGVSKDQLHFEEWQ